MVLLFGKHPLAFGKVDPPSELTAIVTLHSVSIYLYAVSACSAQSWHNRPAVRDGDL